MVVLIVPVCFYDVSDLTSALDEQNQKYDVAYTLLPLYDTNGKRYMRGENSKIYLKDITSIVIIGDYNVEHININEYIKDWMNEIECKIIGINTGMLIISKHLKGVLNKIKIRRHQHVTTVINKHNYVTRFVSHDTQVKTIPGVKVLESLPPKNIIMAFNKENKWYGMQYKCYEKLLHIINNPEKEKVFQDA